MLQFSEMLTSDEDCVLLIVKNEEFSDDEINLLPTEFLDASLKTIKCILEDLVHLDPIHERSARVQQAVLKEVSCYQRMLDERFAKNSEVGRHCCKYCTISFTTPAYLKHHQNICLADKTSTLSYTEQPLHCTQCDKSFTTPNNYRRHMVKHITCNKNSTSGSRLQVVDINQEDIDNAAQLFNKTRVRFQEIKSDGEGDNNGRDAIQVKNVNHTNSDEEGELTEGDYRWKGSTGTESGAHKQGSKPRYSVEGNNEGIEQEYEECDVKFNETLDTSINISEKHKLDIISDHVLQKRNKYWSALELQCVCCGEMFTSPSECDSHIKECRLHQDAGPFICNYCNCCFLNITQLRKHTLSKHKDVPNENNIFLKKHCSTKHKGFPKQMNIKVYSCRVCRVEFNRADILKSHERRHLGIVKMSKNGELMLSKQKLCKTTKPPSLSRINCVICGGSYSTRANLKKHMAIHDGSPQYSCQHCGKTFLKSDCLKYHLRTHTKERPWHCSICSESFSDRRSWLVHLNNHKGLRPYKCECCPVTFVDRRHLNKHISTFHENKFKPKPVYQIVVEDSIDKQNPIALLTEESHH